MTDSQTMSMSRRVLARGLLGGLALVAGLSLVPMRAQAQFRVEISGVGATQIPVAIGRFREEARAPQPLSAIVKADLERSGLFKSLDASAAALDEASRPALSDWKSKGADALLAGSVTQLADGRFDVRYQVWDVLKGQSLGGMSLVVPAGDLRQSAHRIADDIYQKLTGDRGVFATRISYVSKVGSRHTLLVADADGEGAQAALASPQPIISPAWAPDGRQLAYVSFEGGKAVVVVQDVFSGKRRVVAGFKGTNSAPAWSPDGNRLAVVLTQDGSSQIYLIDAEGGKPTRLTSSYGIDTEPAFSPDGGWIYFTSDRGGSPQIYKIPSRGGEAQRVTFEGHYNVSPRVSPDGKTLAFIRNEGGAFRVVAQDLESGVSNILGSTGDDESPSFAPNGRYILYATRVGRQKILAAVSTDGRIRQRLATLSGDVREPAWGPWPQSRNP